ncbi:MAG: M17 family peptidase N-terminal domain-containing protein, partial [Candidatus Limnocylindrus sp.]
MKVIITAKGAAAKAGVLVTPIFSDQLDAPYLREVDSKSGGRIAALRAIGEGTGSRYSSTLTSAGRLPADHLLLVGAGARADFGRQELQRWAAAATRRLAGRKVARLAIDATGIIAALASTAPALRAEGGPSFGAGLSANAAKQSDAAVIAVDLIVRGVIDG